MNPRGPEIRVASAADAEAITRVYMDSARHHAAVDPERYYVPERGDIIERYRTGGQHAAGAIAGITFVAEVDGRLVGFVDAWIDHPFDPMHRPMLYCFVADIAVAEEFRGQGIGERLMSAVEQWGAEQKADFVVLEYNACNARAGAFYERLGYHSASIAALKWLPGKKE